jgi:O-antigen/teichoic acid export membrane protein
VANYLYQFGMGRMLSVPDFGTLNAILSLSVIVSVPATTITLVKAKEVARLVIEQGWGQIRGFYNRFLLQTAIFGGAISVAFTIFHGAFQDFLHLEKMWPVLLFSGLTFWSLLVALNTGFFQGLQRFGTYAALGTGNGLIRFLSAVFLVWAGTALAGALLAAVLSSAIAFVASYMLIRKLLKPYAYEHAEALSSLHLSSTALILFLLTLISFADMVLVKHLFDPEQAGIYAGVSILGRTILYLPAAITQVLLPKVVSTDRENSRHLFFVSTIMTGAISLTGVLLFYLFPDQFLRILLGPRYHGGASLLALYGLAMFFIAILTLFVNFCLAREIHDIHKFLGLVLILEIAGVLLFKTHLSALPICMIVTGFLGCVLLFARIYNETRTTAVT